ncbi:MAG: hypothetical protein NXI32_21040 [bacterium]|nr:hypothetical protein [bacterium]
MNQTGFGQESKLGELLKRTPTTPNAMAYIHVPSLNSLMSSQSMRLEFTDTEEEVWLVSQLDIQKLRPEWEAGYVTLRKEIAIDALAFGVKGYVDEVAGKQVVWCPDESYLMPVTAKSLGVLRPANRSLLSKWIDSAQLGEIPGYLQSQTKQPEQFLSLMLALDLKDLFSPISLVKRLEALESTQQADLASLAQVLASVQGMSIIVGRRNLSECILSIEFAMAPTAVQPIANQLINEILNNNGTAAPEILTWASALNGNTLTLRGPISEDSLHGLVGIFSIASQAEYAVEEAETRPKLTTSAQPSAQPNAVVEARPAAESRPNVFERVLGQVTAPLREDASAYESKKYFDRVGLFIDRVRKYRAQTTGFRAQWNQQNARRIDELPILGVDSKLVEYGSDVAHLLRGNAREIRGINVEAGQEVLDNQQGGFFGGGFGMVGVNNHPRLVSGARAAGSGFLTYQEALLEIESMTADIRREMTLKYKEQF